MPWKFDEPYCQRCRSYRAAGGSTPCEACCIRQQSAELAALKAATRTLIAEIEACDNPSDQGICSHADEVEAVRKLIAE